MTSEQSGPRYARFGIAQRESIILQLKRIDAHAVSVIAECDASRLDYTRDEWRALRELIAAILPDLGPLTVEVPK